MVESLNPLTYFCAKCNTVHTEFVTAASKEEFEVYKPFLLLSHEFNNLYEAAHDAIKRIDRLVPPQTMRVGIDISELGRGHDE